LGALGVHRSLRHVFGWPQSVFYYEDAIRWFSAVRHGVQNGVYPSVLPNWDNTARSQKEGVILHDSTPELFSCHLREVLEAVAHRPFEERIVFVKSWNEWAEGNYLEPDQKFGRGYLDALKAIVCDSTHIAPQTIAEASTV